MTEDTKQYRNCMRTFLLLIILVFIVLVAGVVIVVRGPL